MLDEGVVGVDGRVDVGVCGSGGVEEVDWSICQSGDCHCKVEREHTFSFSEHCLHHLVASFIFVRLPVGFGLAPRVAVLVSPCFACWRLRLALVPSFPGLFRACSSFWAQIYFLKLALACRQSVAVLVIRWTASASGRAMRRCARSKGMLQVWCDGYYRSLEMTWYGPAVLAIVLFSHASFYIFRPSTLASVLDVALLGAFYSLLDSPLTSACHRDLRPAPFARRSDSYTGLAGVLLLAPNQSAMVLLCVRFPSGDLVGAFGCAIFPSSSEPTLLRRWLLSAAVAHRPESQHRANVRRRQ